MIDTCVILAAGAGTRLRDAAPSKPLCAVAGKPLIDHAIERLAEAGIARVIVTTGYRAEGLEAHLAGRDWPALLLWLLCTAAAAFGAYVLLGLLVRAPELRELVALVRRRKN